MDFYMKFWKLGGQEFLFFTLISSGSVPEVFEAQNHGNFPLVAFMQQPSTRHVKKKKKVGSGGNFSVWRIVNQRYFGNICLMQYSSEWLECGCMHRCMNCWIHILPGDFIYLGNSHETLYSKHLRLCFFSPSFDSSYAHMDRKLYLADIRLHCELKPESRKTNE